LVRHGQATAFEQISDRLSSLGETQARKLAQFWIRNQVAFDEVYTGLLARQRRRGELVAEEDAPAGVQWPSARALDELNEYDAESVIRLLAPRLAKQDDQFDTLWKATRAEGPDRNRRFQRMFEVLISRWAAGELHASGIESWTAF